MLAAKKKTNKIYSVFGLEGLGFIACIDREQAREFKKLNPFNKILDLGSRGTLTLKGVKNNRPKKPRYYIIYPLK